VVRNGAIVSPGFSPGTLVFSGDLDLTQGGQADIEIGGFIPGVEHDVIVAHGNVTWMTARF
jgi:hypothetical protein